MTRIWRDQKISIISFVAHTGGLLGLCMGFSLVSLFEIVYYTFNSLPWRNKRNLEDNREQQLYDRYQVIPIEEAFELLVVEQLYHNPSVSVGPPNMHSSTTSVQFLMLVLFFSEKILHIYNCIVPSLL